MRRTSVSLLNVLLPFLLHGGPARAAEVAAAADGENACFGGGPEAVATSGIGGVSDERNAKALHVGDGHLLWQWGDGVEHIELWTWQRDRTLAHRAFLKAADRREAFIMSFSAPSSARGKSGLVAVNLQNHSRRVVVDDQPGMPFHSRVVLDGDFVYFVRSPLSVAPGKNDGFFRARRDGTGQPERLGAEPSGAFTPFLVEGGYVYWSQNDRKGPSAIWRRQLAVDSPGEQLAITEHHHLPMALGNGRLFYLDGERILSVPIDGTAPPVEHVKGIDIARNLTLLVDRNCLYWTTARAIMRARLGGKTPAKPEFIAEEANYRGGPIETDGQHLYWIDQRNHRVLRSGRGAIVSPPRPTLLAKSIDINSLLPDSPDGSLVVGDGWGCAHVLGWREPHWQCWRAESGTGSIQAKVVPWLTSPDLHAGPDRLCYLDRGRPKCWPWPNFTWSRPEDFPQVEKRTNAQVLVGGTFACVTDDPDSDYMLSCEGDNSYEQLAKHDQPDALRVRPAALGTWHGCIGRPFRCWGRGDGGQLGFPPEDKCQVAGRKIACSRDPHKISFPLPSLDELFAGDMFTCAALHEWHGFACWGASRDGWFGDKPCSRDLRKAWPVDGGSTEAPNATCSATPVGVPAFDQVLPKPERGNGLPVYPIGREGGWGPPPARFSVGPRGACVLFKGNLRCVGAIATPVGAFSHVVVNRGTMASVCGLSNGQVLCWGEGYSPAGQPSTPVPIAFERTPPGPSAFVDFPPPAGTAWAPLHLINHGCDRVPAILPKCQPVVSGKPWSELAPDAAVLSGKTVFVQDRLVVGSRAKNPPNRCGPRCCDPKWEDPMGNVPGYQGTDFRGCYRDSRAIVLGDDDHQLGFAEDSPAFDCIGDESRLCCGVQAFGQTVVAQGILDGSDERGWVLRSVSVCELPVTAPQAATVQQRRH